MINVNDLKPGITFEYNNNIYIVIESQHSKSGRGQAHVKTKIKNLRNKAIISKTFIGGDKVKKAFIEQKDMQFLYNDSDKAHFMDNNSYEQIELPIDKKMKEDLLFLVEGINLKVITFNQEILGITLPVNVILTVKSVESAVRGDSSTSSNKKAILETDLELNVPIFIKEGEKILVSTSDKKYVGRS